MDKIHQTAQQLQQQQKNEQPIPDKKEPFRGISRAEYEKKYDLSDPEVFKTQGLRLATVEEIITLQAIMLKLTGHENPKEMWAEVQAWHAESVHFREVLKEKVLENQTNEG